MADIGLVGRGYAGRATRAAAAIPLSGSNIRRRIAAWGHGTLEGARAATRAMFQTSQREQLEKQHFHPRREGFIEDAAMSRAMDRL